MSDWKTIDLLPPDDQARARKLFSAEETALIGDYEFSNFGPKLMRRVIPAKLRNSITPNAPAAAPKKEKREKPAPEEAPKPAMDDGSERVLQVPIASVLPCPLNPRKKYGQQGLKELADTIRSVGRIIHPLVVRPLESGVYEVIAGHRRLKAAPLADLTEVPVIVRPMSDRTALDVMLSENLQREDLTPIEEAEALKAWLALTEEDGRPRTVSMAAAKHGKSEMHIGNMLRLLRLPKKAREALEGEVIGRELGAIIAKMPTAELRKRFTDEVLKGHGEGALSTREAREHARRSYMVELRGSPFDQRTASLVPINEKDGERIAGGACTDCTLNTANMQDAEEARTHLCTNPGCYASKVQAHVSQAKEKALAAGMVVVEGEKARRYVYHDGTPHHESGMVKLDQTPTQAEVVGERKPPTWKKMLAVKATGEIVTGRTPDGDAIKGKVTGQIKVPAVLVIDERGRTHEMVERKTAIEAAKKNGFGDLFSARASRAKSSGQAEPMARESKEREAAKLETRAAVLGLEELTAAISASQGINEAGWQGVLELALFHAGSDGETFVCHRRAIDVAKNDHGHPDREKALRKHAAALAADRVPALAVELLLAGWMKHRGVDAPGFEMLAAAYGVDIKSLRSKAKDESGAKAKKKTAKKEEAEPKSVRDLIAELAPKHGLHTLEAINELAVEAIGKKYEELVGSELTALVEAIKELPIPPKIGKGDWLYDDVDNADACPECGATFNHTDDSRHVRACVCGFSGWTAEVTRAKPEKPARKAGKKGGSK